MEAKVSATLLGLVIAAWASFGYIDPTALQDAEDRGADAELVELEDRFATDRSNGALAQRLADHYLSMGEPGLAVATLSAADPSVRRRPAVLSRLARAYEDTGRLYDALSTAQLARARCARALGSSEASTETPVPAFRCSEGTLAALDMHANALGHMVRWGVTDPRLDARAARAYMMATRSARLVSASAL